MITNPTKTTSSNEQQHHEDVTEASTIRARAKAAPRADHYANQTNSEQDQDPRPERSRARTEDAHLCITILGSGPAFGRPESRTNAVPFAADLGGSGNAAEDRSSGC